MDDMARGVEGAFFPPFLNIQKSFKNLSKHFRINCDFAFQRLVFADGKIEAIENFKKTFKKAIRYIQAQCPPVIAAQGFEQAAV